MPSSFCVFDGRRALFATPYQSSNTETEDTDRMELRPQLLQHPIFNWRRVFVEQRDADIGVQKVVQSKYLRIGGFRCLRPFGKILAGPKRFNSASHSAGSELIGSSKTPPATLRIRTRVSCEAEFLGQADGLAAAIFEQFGDFALGMVKVYTNDIYPCNGAK